MLRLILLHEIFHFVWTRLDNAARDEFKALLKRESRSGARGELGESSAVKKACITQTDLAINSRLWRDYVCESFCDTAAWIYSGVGRDQAFTLANRWRERRKVWFCVTFARGCKC